MAAYRRLGPEARAAFDAFVAAAPRPDFLQGWAWGEVKASTGWRPHRLWLLAEGRGATPVASCLVLERAVPGLGPLLYAPRGPMVDWRDRAAADAALEALAAFGRQRRAIALKLDPAVPAEADDGCAAALARHGFRRLATGLDFAGVQPRFVMHLPLQGKDEQALLAGMHPKTRYNIRLALRRGVRVREASAADVPAFYALLQETAARDGFAVRALPYFQTLYRELVAPGQGWLLLAEGDGELLAAALVLHVGPTAWYLYGASSSRRRELMPAYAVQWEAIRRAVGAGCMLYDLRGISGDLSESNRLYGLYRFKRGFGAQRVEYVGEWDLPLRPLAYAALRQGLPRARRLLAALRGRPPAPPGGHEGE